MSGQPVNAATDGSQAQPFTPLHLFMALTVIVLWGVTFIAMKSAVTQIPPLAVLTIRFAMVGALLLPFCRMPKPNEWRGIFAVSITLCVLHFGCMAIGMQRVDAAISAILMQTGVPFSALIAFVVFRETFGWRRTAGLIVAFAGVVILAGEPRTASQWPYVLITLGGAFFWAVNNIIVKSLPGTPILVMTAWASIMAAPILGGLSWLVEEGQVAAVQAADWRAWASILFMVVASSIVSYMMFYKLLEWHSVNKVAPLMLAVPVVGMAAGVFLLGEPFGVVEAVGAALTLGGVAVIQLRMLKKSGEKAA